MLAETYPIQTLCRTLDCTRSTYYYRQGDEIDAGLRAAIQELAGQWPTYGYRRITAHLQRAGWAVNHKRMQRLMQAMGLQGKAPKRKLRYCSRPMDVPATSTRSIRAVRSSILGSV